MRDHTSDMRVFKAFCDVNRLQILQLLRSGEKCACALLEHLHISQSTLSYHMKILCDSGVVVGRTEGKWTHYSLREEGCAHARQLLEELTDTSAVTPTDCACK